MMKTVLYLFIISTSITASISSSIFRLYSEDEMELCYGKVYIDWLHNMINIKYHKSYIPFRYTFVNSTFSVDEVNDYIFFTRSIFLKHRYSSSNASLVITLTGNVQKHNLDQCSVNISCFIKNLITYTSTSLTSKDRRSYSLRHLSSCVIVMGYDTIMQYNDDQLDDLSDTYGFTIYLLFITSILIVLVYTINKIKMNS
ncbi:type I membrane glycoprotein [Skunkpox virus]|uniref:Type I membrane glycoprotein n=1 Tax=Skunkpox virus TaxID=160796 RepID=A0A1C9KBV6_9POXV|nr:type I membrane glycoprotein [Skunkpox virus]AOP31642.1 type I membrane glycoprotein [Skunkpox virus]